MKISKHLVGGEWFTIHWSTKHMVAAGTMHQRRWLGEWVGSDWGDEVQILWAFKKFDLHGPSWILLASAWKSHAANVLNSKNNSRSMWASRRALLRSTDPHNTSVENSTSQIWTNPKENLLGASHVWGAQIAKGQECWISTGKSNRTSNSYFNTSQKNSK